MLLGTTLQKTGNEDCDRLVDDMRDDKGLDWTVLYCRRINKCGKYEAEEVRVGA